MPRVYPRALCKRCNGHRETVGEMTKRGLCLECAKSAVAAANVQISEHNGPIFDHWRKQMARSVGALFPEDLQKVS